MQRVFGNHRRLLTAQVVRALHTEVDYIHRTLPDTAQSLKLKCFSDLVNRCSFGGRHSLRVACY
jgi:hypothetical protein